MFKTISSVCGLGCWLDVDEFPVDFRYQKTAEGVKAGAEKTGSMFGGFTANLSARIGAIKESETFRSLEEKVGSAYTNVKVRLTSSASSA